MHARSSVFLALCALATASQAQTFIVPAGLDEATGLNTALRNAPRTYMAL